MSDLRGVPVVLRRGSERKTLAKLIFALPKVFMNCSPVTLFLELPHIYAKVRLSMEAMRADRQALA
jgi:hypothetical protein